MPTSDRNPLVLGSNLEQKEAHRTKYRDSDSKKYLKEIKAEYDKWHSDNIKLVGPTSLQNFLADENQVRRLYDSMPSN